MVNSHSKNATTQSTLTYAERARLKATSGSRRIGGESFKPYDHCHLCLSLLVSPVSCSKGHMYCRECAVSDLIQQKAGIESQKREMERWAAKEEGERQDARRAARERVVRDFEKSMGVGWVGAGGQGAGKGVAAVGEGGSGRKKGVEELMKEAEDRALRKIEAEQAESRKAKLPAFWLPSLAPEGRVGPIKDVKVQALCHFGGEPHAISRKTLLPVILHYPASSKTPHCPSCSRELSNAVPSVLLSSRQPASTAEAEAEDRPKKKKKSDKEEPYVCGHVFCKSCADTMIRPAGRCSVCEAKVGEGGMIAMGKEGTGFAAAGGSEVKSSSIVFRV